MKQKVLITGIAGFIGSSLARVLSEKGYFIVGLDNFNDYYSVDLKKDRVTKLLPSSVDVNEIDLLDFKKLDSLFSKNNFDAVIHLAAQAGVRHSIEHPDTYIQTNVQGTNNIFELAKKYNVKKVVYASSSSVYGGNKKVPFSESDRVDNPISLYAATKKANELQANVYSSMFGLNMVGLRFFTVYGPWGRPDMALFKFTKNIIAGKPIDVYNNGNMVRDFTFVDDIVSGVVRALETPLKNKNEIFNLGNSQPTPLNDFIFYIEQNLGKKAIRNNMPMQPGDVEKTSADISKAKKLLGYEPKTSVEEGVKKFVEWYRSYYGE